MQCRVRYAHHSGSVTLCLEWCAEHPTVVRTPFATPSGGTRDTLFINFRRIQRSIRLDRVAPATQEDKRKAGEQIEALQFQRPAAVIGQTEKVG